MSEKDFNIFLGIPLTKYKTDSSDLFYEYNIFNEKSKDRLLYEKLSSKNTTKLKSKVNREFFIKNKDILIRTMQPFNVSLFYDPIDKIVVPSNYIIVRIKPKSKIIPENIWTILNNEWNLKILKIMNQSSINQGILSVSTIKDLLFNSINFMANKDVRYKLFVLLCKQQNLYRKKKYLLKKRNSYYVNYKSQNLEKGNK